jgi:hypothetical protein
MNEFKAMYLDGVYDPAMTVHDAIINSQEYIDKIVKNKPIDKPIDPAIWRMKGKPFIPALMMGPTRLNRLKSRGIANWIQHVADHGFNGTELNPMAEWFGLDNVFFSNVKDFTPRQDVLNLLREFIVESGKRNQWVHIKLFGDVQSDTHIWSVKQPFSNEEINLYKAIGNSLADLENWSCGWGWDVYEFVSSTQAEEWVNVMKPILGNGRKIGVRPDPDSSVQLAANCTYGSAEQVRPTPLDLFTFRSRNVTLPLYSEDTWRKTELYNRVPVKDGKIENRNISEIEQLKILWFASMYDIGGAFAVLPDRAEPWMEDADGSLGYAMKAQFRIWKQWHDEFYADFASGKYSIFIETKAGRDTLSSCIVINALESEYKAHRMTNGFKIGADGLWIVMQENF